MFYCFNSFLIQTLLPISSLHISFILVKSKDLFKICAEYYGIYRDDGIVFLKGKWSDDEIVRWLKTFQIKVNDILDSEKVKFTAEIWRPSDETKETVKLNNQVNVLKVKTYPFLDMAIFWGFNRKLKFKIYMKENQVLKYLNKGSCHTSKCFKAIPLGVLGSITRLTYQNKKILNSRKDSLSCRVCHNQAFWSSLTLLGSP